MYVSEEAFKRLRGAYQRHRLSSVVLEKMKSRLPLRQLCYLLCRDGLRTRRVPRRRMRSSRHGAMRERKEEQLICKDIIASAQSISLVMFVVLIDVVRSSKFAPVAPGPRLSRKRSKSAFGETSLTRTPSRRVRRRMRRGSDLVLQTRSKDDRRVGIGMTDQNRPDQAFTFGVAALASPRAHRHYSDAPGYHQAQRNAAAN
ncbi:uncharacterized protein FOMMEDRAFT_152412 [Fomitiporia mediterranea MF3/22]|uniref:uncharacterized protein n=1 Tax=Fomitiporia mediterranea (strain MF3/22) TaxID=694068 RepID=UPI0004409596|nr:uncharacterized protein FOMMEDRAFT_152412 [Fomitiporia mediterranea MF3/22]EJD07062.1 hypothetical protein FOMMEDRAFT_152412 [Fomitiporia mediterranea MF3/22]